MAAGSTAQRVIMDVDGPHKQEFHLRNLPTRSVTLFPTQAQVVRDIKDVTLKPGANEITVVGLTPTTDEHSIKVEGTGAAIITDIVVELLPNREIFQEIYPDSDSEDEKEESEEEEPGHRELNAAVKAVRAQLVALSDQQKRAKEILASAESRLKMLDSHGNSLDRKENVDIEASVETYRKEREKVFHDHMDGVTRERALANDIAKLKREEARLLRLQAKEDEKAAKEKAKIRRAKEKLKEKQRRRDEEHAKEKMRIRRERENFWPRLCYTVRISLDAGASFTPGSSRRNSIASSTDVQLVSGKGVDEDETGSTLTCDLTLSYVTSAAFWSPSYDLVLSSTTNTAMLSFDARLTNMTSETWANSKVILSTSQASFSGLNDDTPVLAPWRLRICGKGGGHWDGLDIAHSNEERAHKQAWNAAQRAAVEQNPRAALFGMGFVPQQQLHQVMAASKMSAPAQGFGAPNPQLMQPLPQARAAAQQQLQMMNQHQAQMMGQQAQAPAANAFGASNTNTVPRAAGLFGASNVNTGPPGGGGLFGSSNANTGLQVAGGAFGTKQFASRAARVASSATTSEGFAMPLPDDDDGADAGSDADAQTMLDAPPEVNFQDSSFEETGLTATYDLPHLKTLKPSSTASKQRVARISFTNLTFSRTVVAKYKPAAYLRARLRNTSKLTLLKGPTGLTLDGTFLGRTTLPRCSAGDSFNVPLGIDPAIKVAYPKPDVTRSTTGVFTKGENSVYTRSVTLVNTRAAAGKAVGITVVDQVPVSEDEKLRVEVLQPGGMQGGRAVAAGVPGKEGKEELDWGRATASLKKAGEVQWDVLLNAGRSVKLVLQYEVAFPTGERVAQVL